MKTFPLLYLLLLLCILPDHHTTATKIRRKKELTKYTHYSISILSHARSIIKDIIKIWNRPVDNPDVSVKSFLFEDMESQLLHNVKMISTKIKSLESEVKKQSQLTSFLQHFPKTVKVELQLQELTSIINQINFAAEKLKEYLKLGYKNTTSTREEENMNSSHSKNESTTPRKQNNRVDLSGFKMSRDIIKRATHSRPSIERYTLEDFATWATSHSSNSLMPLLRNLNNLIVTDSSYGILYLMRDTMQETYGGLCNLRESPHQVLYNLYVKIALAQLKGHVVLQFSYMILKMYNKGDFISEAESALQTYERYSKSEVEVVRNVLSSADRSFYKCDPKQYVSDVTYTKLTRLLQGYIENEVNLNPYGTCRENCRYYSFANYNGCFKEQFCSKQPPCSGKVLNCDYVDSDMKICTSSDPERRYDWVNYKRGKSLGNKGVCEKKKLFNVDSWWRYLFWHCSYCLCLCDGGDDVQLPSDRYFNLRDVTSDIEKNKVVTGVRIVKNNKIIHIQIQQGVLTANGIVNSTSLSWKPVDNYTVNDPNVRNEVDYHTMSWLERAIDVDEVFGPPEHVVTGIRLRKIGVHLNLEVRVTPINFTSGEVFKEQYSYWLGNDNTDASATDPREEIILSEPDIPIRNGPHFLNSKNNQYIQFQASSFKTDVGQSTVPYLDAQALVSEGTPISGIGLIHRGKEGSGGFIAPKIISYDFTPHIRFDKDA